MSTTPTTTAATPKQGGLRISKVPYLMGRDVAYPLTEKMKLDMLILLTRVDRLLAAFEATSLATWTVTSGYRPGPFNVAAGGNPNSCHLLCQAVDIADPHEALDTYIDQHPEVLPDFQLWREHPTQTPGWVHLDIRARPKYTFMK